MAQNEAALLPTRLAAVLAAAERPGALFARDGSALRLVAPNERLALPQMQEVLGALLRQPHMQQLIASEPSLGLLTTTTTASSRRPNNPPPPRHVAAWLRGCCYLEAGNSRQALRDARAALAYAPAAEVPWFPALLLAGEAYAALGDCAQAVLHLSKAQTCAPAAGCAAAASDAASAALQRAVRGLSPDQALAWATGRAEGLAQQLQDEADMRLPEVLRPRPKWYYYTQWTRQRIHLTLLELHLAALMPAGGCSTSTSTSTSSARGRLLLGLLAEGASDEVPAVAAAAAAAGFQVLPVTAGPAALALPANNPDTAAAAQAEPSLGNELAAAAGSCALSRGTGSSSSSVGGVGVLQLPEPVLAKLLSLDAGDLDLMLQHPVALQGQVYELLDVLQAQGPAGLQEHAIQPLTWAEVQGLAGTTKLVGLPLDYTPQAALPAPGAAACLQLAPAAAAAAGEAQAALPLALAGPDADTDGHAGSSGSSGASSYSRWHRPGWVRAQYGEAAAAAAATAAGAAL